MDFYNLLDLLERISDDVEVEVLNQYNDTVAVYDGKNSIDTLYNTFELADFQVDNGKVTAWIYEDFGR